jgi:hydrogenase expression/formation protein HypE
MQIKMKKIEIGHGSGGKLTRDLIENIFLKYLQSPELNPLEDAATVCINSKEAAITTDSYVIRPLFFPGSDIGKLSVCGTVNDLTVSGAIPRYLTLGFIIEEGFPFSDLERIVESISQTAQDAEVEIVTGDTKVVEKGKCDGIYINTTGFGEIAKPMVTAKISEGDKIILTGTMGDHGTSVAIAREEFTIDASVQSDCAPLNDLLTPLFEIDGVKWMRDPTRGGVATVMVELSDTLGMGICIYEDSLPVREDVQFISDMLGYDPLYIANEGKAIIVASVGSADKVIELLRKHPLGVNAAIIGHIDSNFSGVILKTKIGGERILDMLEEEILPRIC